MVICDLSIQVQVFSPAPWHVHLLEHSVVPSYLRDSVHGEQLSHGPGLWGGHISNHPQEQLPGATAEVGCGLGLVGQEGQCTLQGLGP